MGGANPKSFSNGVRFRSRHKTLRLVVFFTTGTCEEGEEGEEEEGSKETCRLSSRLKGAWLCLCLLMWPPRACPIANSRPQMEHSCVLGLVGEPCGDCEESRLDPSPPIINLGFLWLARWPPSAWNDGNCRLQVLHSKTRLGELEKTSISAPRESSIKQFAMVLMLSSSLPVMLLFMVRVNSKKETFDKNKGRFCLQWEKSEWNLGSLRVYDIYRLGLVTLVVGLPSSATFIF